MKGTTVFLVDDHALMRDGLSSVLRAQGFVVVGEAADVNGAIAPILRTRPQLLLLDVGLALRSGLDLLARLRLRALSAQVVMLTMSAQPWHVANAWRLGARSYVLKGSGSAVLLQAMHAALMGGSFLDPALHAQRGAIDQHITGGDLLSDLTTHEREMMLAMVQGCSSRSIGQQMHLTSKTVDTYRSRLMAKLGVKDLPELVRLAVRVGMLDAAAH
jgi:two-component system, NarL family, invasion response regulator UvrY